MLAGVGHDVTTATKAAAHARAAGARMIMVHQPVSPYLSADGWVDYHVAIAEAVPDIGVVLYIREPRITGQHIRRLGELCPNVVGVKYGVRDQVQFAAVARDAGLDRFTWLAGLAELTAPGCWTYGARGFTSGLVNVAPKLSVGMLYTLRGGDWDGAMKIWESCRAFEELRAADASADNVSVVKEALAQLGLARRDVRPPSRLLPENDPRRDRQDPRHLGPHMRARARCGPGSPGGRVSGRLGAKRRSGGSGVAPGQHGSASAGTGCARSATAPGCASSAPIPRTTRASRSSRSSTPGPS